MLGAALKPLHHLAAAVILLSPFASPLPLTSSAAQAIALVFRLPPVAPVLELALFPLHWSLCWLHLSEELYHLLWSFISVRIELFYMFVLVCDAKTNK